MKRKDKELLDEAYRARAGMIGILGSCTCAYPLVAYPEKTQHAVECPAHYMISVRISTAPARVLELAGVLDINRVARNGGGS